MAKKNKIMNPIYAEEFNCDFFDKGSGGTYDAWDHAGYMLSKKTYGRKLEALQVSAYVVWTVVVMEWWVLTLINL